MKSQELLSSFLQEVNAIGDGLGLGLDEKIKRPVAILRMMGFDTYASCEGHQDYSNPKGKTEVEKWGRYDKDDKVCYPWIDIGWLNIDLDIYPFQKILEQLTKMELLAQNYNDPRIVLEKLNKYGFTLRTKCSSLEEGQRVIQDFTEWLLK